MATITPRRTPIGVPTRSRRSRFFLGRTTAAPQQWNYVLNRTGSPCTCNCNCNCINCLCSPGHLDDEPWNPHRVNADAISRASTFSQAALTSIQGGGSSVGTSIPELTPGGLSDSEDEIEEDTIPGNRDLRGLPHHFEDDYDHIGHHEHNDYNARDNQHWVHDSAVHSLAPHHHAAIDDEPSTSPEDEDPHRFYLEQPTANSYELTGSPPTRQSKPSESGPLILGNMDVDPDSEQDISSASLHPLMGSHMDATSRIRSPADSISSLIGSLLSSISNSKTNSPMNASATLNGVGMGFGDAPGPSDFPSRKPSWSPNSSAEERAGSMQWLPLLDHK